MDITHRRGASSREGTRAPIWPASVWRLLRLAARWLFVMLLAILLAVGAMLASMQSPAGHIRQLVIYLAMSGIVALLVGALARWIVTLPRLSSVRLQLAVPPALTALVIAVTAVLLAHGMFISVEDSALLLIFLTFAVVVALALAGSLAGELGRTIAHLERGARRMAGGEYDFRVTECEVGATRELRQLAHWFNQMAANIEDAFARRQAAEAERRQVIAALSHDLRTPLASTRAMLEAIDDGVVTDAPTVRRYQRVMRAELVRLGVLMDELFDLARLDAGALPLTREPLSIEDLLSDALEAFREQAEQAGIRLEGWVEDNLPTLSIDPRQIYRTLTNLLQNALQHLPRNGVVLLRARSQVGSDGRLEVVVQVIDMGTGISAGDLPHIFERAYRGEVSRRRQPTSAPGAGAPGAGGPGAGLGLAIARGIVELHGGRIWATSPLPTELRALVQPLRQGVAEDEVRPELPGTVVSFSLPSQAPRDLSP